MRNRLIVFAALGLCFLALPALADARFDRVRAAFENWADGNHIPDASVVLVEGGKIAGKYDRGRYTTATPVPVASDSKLITGLCVVRAVEDGKLTFKTPIKNLLPKIVGSARDPRAGAITVGQLLTHSSGITYDPSQGADIGQFAPFTQRSDAAQVRVALSRPLGNAPGTHYFYNNENYAALGLVIASVTHEDYIGYCSRTVLAPVGITDASFNPKWMVMGAYGPWLISAEDYAKLLSYLAPGSRLLSIPPGQWPKFGLGGGISYSAGALLRKDGDWFNFWHFGSWVHEEKGNDASFGAYYADWGGQTAVFADYAPTISDAQQSALDAAMAAAAAP